ncbi:MAG: transposase [Elusimicrobia bacterium]|nr:transposase [Elusimicrobiota bacterium]
MRKEKLVSDEIYHVFNKSIASYKIFNSDDDYDRFLYAVNYYTTDRKGSFSSFLKSKEKTINHSDGKYVKIVSYCFMPTHFHLVLKQLEENGIVRFISNLSNSYAKYFNLKHNRKGPLWEGRFRNVLVKTDEQILHLTRYIHLNPVTAYLVDKPGDWRYSSYREYLNVSDKKICSYSDILVVKPDKYKEFVEDRISYQRELAKIKELICE